MTATQAALRPLSGDQIRTLVLLCRQAYALEFPQPEADFDTWRHDLVRRCVERGGLTECCNEDFLYLKAHLLNLLGREGEAQAAQERAAVEPRTWAMHFLQQACSEAADVLPRAMNYAAGFIRNKRGVAIEDADDRTLKHAAFVVKRRAEQLRAKRRAA